MFEAARERLAGLGLAVVAPDALPASDVYLLSLPTSAHVREVIETSPGLLALAPKGSVIVDTSTSDPAVSRELAEKVTAAGLHWLDAPVSGGPKGAANGTLGMLRATPVASDRNWEVLNLRSAIGRGNPRISPSPA